MRYAFLSLMLATAPLMAATPQTNAKEETMQDQKTTHNQVTADQLKSWYSQNRPMTIVDARTKTYFDGRLLPDAKWLSAEASDEEIEKALPSKSGLIVVYCGGEMCPASGWLYDKLSSMGYTNIYEYHGGLKDWVKKGFPTIQTPMPNK